jgi:phosphopantetheinyl transferase
MLDALELIELPLDEDGIEVGLLDLSRLPDLEPDAAGVLAGPERAEYAELRHPSRRREWLGARVCLKLMVVRRGRVAAPLDCVVIKDPRGRPRLAVASAPAVDVVADCSLSHKTRFACAAVSRAPGSRIGVDVEEIAPRLRRLTRQFVHADDRMLDAHPEDERLAILWALKEACSKVLGRGLAMALRDIVCVETAPGRHRVVTGELALAGRHITYDGYVIALCVGAERMLER